MKRIRLSNHAHQRCRSRGTSEQEVRRAVLRGVREPAKGGRSMCRLNFQYNGISIMKITYDPDVDAMYIQLIEGDHECRSVVLSDEVALHFGDGEKLVGIEILDAKRVIGKGKLPRLVVDSLELVGPRIANGRRKLKGARKVGGRVRKAG